MDKFKVCQVVHSVSNLHCKLHQVFDSRTLQKVHKQKAVAIKQQHRMALKALQIYTSVYYTASKLQLRIIT